MWPSVLYFQLVQVLILKDEELLGQTQLLSNLEPYTMYPDEVKNATK